jgi:hypothetical protein
MHLMDHGACAAGARVFWVASNCAIERSERLAWSSHRQVDFAQDPLHSQRAWILCRKLLAERKGGLSAASRDLSFYASQAF